MTLGVVCHDPGGGGPRPGGWGAMTLGVARTLGGSGVP